VVAITALALVVIVLCFITLQAQRNDLHFSQESQVRAVSSMSSASSGATMYYTPPLTREELGRASWALLHTMASTYPVKPSVDQQTAMTQFIHSLSILFPCQDCANHFRARISSHPPNVNSRSDLAQWFCEAHNAVNLRQGKSMFDCSTILSYWPSSLHHHGNAADCGCGPTDSNPDSTNSASPPPTASKSTHDKSPPLSIPSDASSLDSTKIS